MEEPKGINLSTRPSEREQGILDRAELIDKFWDHYEESGMEEAALYLVDKIHANVEIAKLLVPYLMAEAQARGIDQTNFMADVTEFTTNYEKENNQDANGTIDISGGVPTECSDEADVSEDEDEAAPARDADGKADGAKGSSISS